MVRPCVRARERRHARIVGVQHRGSVGRQRLDQLALGRGDAFDGIEAFDVRRSRRWSPRRRSAARSRPARESRPRDSSPFRAPRRARCRPGAASDSGSPTWLFRLPSVFAVANPFGEHLRDHILRGRLAGASRHRRPLRRPTLVAPDAASCLQRLQRHPVREDRKTGPHSVCDSRSTTDGRRALCEHFADVRVPVMIRTAQARRTDRRAAPCANRSLQPVTTRDPSLPAASPIARALPPPLAARSSFRLLMPACFLAYPNDRRTSPRHFAIVEMNGPVLQNLIRLVPFARQQHHVARAAPARAPANRLARDPARRRAACRSAAGRPSRRS